MTTTSPERASLLACRITTSSTGAVNQTMALAAAICDGLDALNAHPALKELERSDSPGGSAIRFPQPIDASGPAVAKLIGRITVRFEGLKLAREPLTRAMTFMFFYNDFQSTALFSGKDLRETPSLHVAPVLAAAIKMLENLAQFVEQKAAETSAVAPGVKRG